MAQAKRRKYRSVEFTPPPEKKQLETQQLVLTLSVAEGDLVKVEKLDKSGQRQEISEKDLAVLTGEDEFEDLGVILEEAYVAGITDATDDELGEDEEEDDARFSLREAARRQLLRRLVRQLVLRRILRRRAMQRRARSASKVTQKAPSTNLRH